MMDTSVALLPPPPPPPPPAPVPDAEAEALARVPVALLLDDISDSTLGIDEEEITTLRDGVDAK